MHESVVMMGEQQVEELYDYIRYSQTRADKNETELSNYVSEMRESIHNLEDEIEITKKLVETAITKAVHELIEYLRCNDIQALDEEEFREKVKKLILDEEGAFYMPF